ncbi:hypothetical protein GCM10010289_85840 [Streptomyces violascens]|nr:hypothetical protein GCM10010289_85840 [Streptomyces violascens]
MADEAGGTGDRLSERPRSGRTHARYIEKRLCWQAELAPAIQARLGTPADPYPDPCAKAIVATVFACIDTATELWARSEGQLDLSNLYDQCLTAVRDGSRDTPLPATAQTTRDLPLPPWTDGRRPTDRAPRQYGVAVRNHDRAGSRLSQGPRKGRR